jgi:3',5'-cyclic AMP phosphodiesterase CpdA
MSRIAFLSDLHLSHTHGFFWGNFRRAAAAAGASGAEAVIVTGDLCINGPDSDEEMEFAATALRGIKADVLALPGNHDVGDEPPGQDPAQIIDAARLARWQGYFGPDRFARHVGAWLLVGLNAQLLGSGLPQEAEQESWLADRLEEAAGKPVALILHKPLFLEHAAEAEPTISSINAAPRARLLALLLEGGVRLVVSGHLHAHRDRVVDGIRHLWLPATAFLGAGAHGGTPAVGAMVVDFGSEAAPALPLDVPGLERQDLAAIKQHGRYRFLRDMPACPPSLAA